MRSGTIAFLLSICCVSFFSSLPSNKILLAAAAFITLIFVVIKNKFPKFFFYGVIFFCGLFYAIFFAKDILQYQIEKEVENKPLKIVGTIISIPSKNNLGNRFDFLIDQYLYHQHWHKTKMIVRLNWLQKNKILLAGEHWQFKAKIKRTHGFANPGSMNIETIYLQNHIRGTGYIITSKQNVLLSAIQKHYFLLQTRQFIISAMTIHLANNPYAGMLKALAVGEKSAITKDQWQVFSATGTNHLVVIAGLHIGICASFMYFLVGMIWSRCGSWPLYLPTPLAKTIAALGAAIIYSAMAGFSVPTLRALTMLFVFMIGVLAKRNISPWLAICIALDLVLIIDPLNVLSMGFWLSFAAVAMICYGMNQRINCRNFWWRHGRIQWVVGVGLLPLTIFFFQIASLTSFFANSIAIPYVGFLVEPLCIIGALSLLFNIVIGSYILKFCALLLSWFWPILQWLAKLPHAVFSIHYFNGWIFISICIAILLLLAPRGFPSKYLFIVWFLPLFYWQSNHLQLKQVALTVLDVGQGLAIVVSTAHHNLIFDAGPKFADDFDAGSAFVLPYLTQKQIKTVDKLIISHGDNDHIGGAFAILKNIFVNQIDTSVPQRFKNFTAHHCLAEKNWRWDGVLFQYLYPPKQLLNLGNDSSCVLLIDNGRQKILLTGDIEKSAEKYLVANKKTQLAADILIAPHHGSITSSTVPFINAVAPKYVVFATGYLNRFNFPNAKIVTRYHARDVRSLNTANSGAICFLLDPNKSIGPPEQYRWQHQRYWFSK